jgi:tRNA threonylcarbamoyl adenosine modification protein YjeE
MNTFTTSSKTEMIDLARKLAGEAGSPNTLTLKGTLGAGKSFFAKHFINSLTEEETEVLSPTFNLVYSYPTKKGEIFHFDLYRLKNAEELENIGFFDALENGICLIEWPEIAEKFLPKKRIEIEIKTVAGLGEEAREITLQKFL